VEFVGPVISPAAGSPTMRLSRRRASPAADGKRDRAAAACGRMRID
jgi:hypothetical protein